MRETKKTRNRSRETDTLIQIGRNTQRERERLEMGGMILSFGCHQCTVYIKYRYILFQSQCLSNTGAFCFNHSVYQIQVHFVSITVLIKYRYILLQVQIRLFWSYCKGCYNQFIVYSALYKNIIINNKITYISHKINII